MSRMCLTALAAGVMAVGTGAGAADLPPLSITSVNLAGYTSGTVGATELSGLTYVGGNKWFAISDGTGRLIEMEIDIHPVTGSVTSASAVSGVTLAGASDLEGVAWDPTTGSVWVSDETGPAIRRHDPDTGAALQTLSLPAVYANIRSNFSLESLTRDPSTGELWTANEEALSVDGLVSTTTAGTVVRLQRFDASGTPTGQWAYVTEKISGDSPLTTDERSGVADLLALPDGRLLVLERELGGTPLPQLTNRLYLVDFDGATDVSGLAELDGQTYTPVSKTLLWSTSVYTNFEGLGLGPTLADGSRSLLLISDDEGGILPARIYALRIEGVVPESGLLAPAGLLIAGLLRRRGRSVATYQLPVASCQLPVARSASLRLFVSPSLRQSLNPPLSPFPPPAPHTSSTPPHHQTTPD